MNNASTPGTLILTALQIISLPREKLVEACGISDVVLTVTDTLIVSGLLKIEGGLITPARDYNLDATLYPKPLKVTGVLNHNPDRRSARDRAIQAMSYNEGPLTDNALAALADITHMDAHKYNTTNVKAL